jgi:hypothetical protein
MTDEGREKETEDKRGGREEREEREREMEGKTEKGKERN